MPEPTIPDVKKMPSVSAQRLYHLLTQFHAYHDVWYPTKAEELAASNRATEGTASTEEAERYRKFERSKLRANWFTAVQGFAYLLLGELLLDPRSEKYKEFLKRIATLKAVIDGRRGTGVLVSDAPKPEEEIKHKIEDQDVEDAEILIKELLQEYVGTRNMDDVDALMQQYPIE